MKAAWHRLSRFCLIAAVCLAAWNGFSALPAHAESCSELIADGGFEAGDAWELSVTPAPPETVDQPTHSGARSLALGILQGENVVSYSSARQLITIPTGATQARLSFWSYAVVGAEAGADKMQAVLLNPDDTTLAVLWTASGNSPTWSQQTYDVTPWRGRTVQVYFTVINDGAGGATVMYLDDVSLAVCPASVTAGASAAATTPDAPQGSADPAPSATEEAQAAVFFTPESDLTPAQGSPDAVATPDPPQGSGTPALVFFTPTADPAQPGAASNASQLLTRTPDLVMESDAAQPGSQLTRVSLQVTPPWTSMPRPTWITAAPRETSSPSGPNTGAQAPFVRWPKGWWFVVAGVLAIILAAWAFAWRSS